MSDVALMNVKLFQAYDPINAATNATTTSSAIDTQGCDSMAYCVYYGTNGDALDGSNYFSAKLTECDTSGGSYTDVPAANIIGAASNVFATNNAAADDNAMYCIGSNDTKRYIKVVVTKTGLMTNGTPFCIFAFGTQNSWAEVGTAVGNS